MTLISSPAPLTSIYSYPSIYQSSADNNTTLTTLGLSWLQPATAPSSATSQKYRTLASIRSQTLQQTLYNLDTPPVSPLSPSIKPAPFDTLPSDHNSIHSHVLTHARERHANSATKSASSITKAIQDMDNSHGTCFLTWIHNPANLDYISLRLKPLCLEYPLVDVANVLRWIGADWSSTDCKALFRAVTQSWDQGKRRMLAFLLIRDEEMRQKAKSKLVEFAQKSRANKNQIRRSHQIQPQQQQQQQQLHNHIQSTLNSNNTTVVPVVPVVPIVPTGPAKTHTSINSIESNPLKDWAAAAAASLILGGDILDSVPVENSVACASKSALSTKLRQSRYSPY